MLCLGCLLCAGGAVAQDAPAGADTAVAEGGGADDALTEARAPRAPLEVAREHMERGQALYEAGRYIEAATEFLRAYDAQPFAAFLYNAGVAYEKLDDGARAAEYFTRFLESEPAAYGADKLRARIARLRGGTPSGADVAGKGAADGAGGKDDFKSLLSVETTPPDATVTIKDEAGRVLQEGTGAQRAETIDPGSYFAEVRHPKYKTIATPITVGAGKVYVIIVELSQGQFLGLLRAESDVPGAAVYVDRRDKGALGRTPLQVAVTTGKHHLWIERPGYRVVEREVDVGVGDEVLIDVALERVDHGRIRVVANRPDAEVFIDGVSVGKVPLEREVDAGTRSLRVTAPGMKDWTTQLTVARGQATPVRVRMRPRMGRAGAWVTAGLAGGVLTASVVLAALGKHTINQLDDERSARTLESDDERARRAKWMYVSADVGFALTALLAGLTTYYFLRDPLPDSDGRVLSPRDWALTPYLEPTRGGAHYQLSF